MKNWPILLYILIPFIVISLGIYFEITLWNECRETNSFWYCMRVLSK